MAFLSTPGIEWLYSGVAIRIASASPMAARSSNTPRGGIGAASSSASNGATALSPSNSTSSAPGGSSRPASRRSFVLYESRRSEPEIPRMRMAG